MSLLVVGAVVLAALGGASIGALSRQPEINKLKRVVRKLQYEANKMEHLRKDQEKQIDELLINYKSLKLWNFRQKRSVKSNIRGVLLYQYAEEEYMRLLIRQVRDKEELDQVETVFFNIFDKYVDGKQLSSEEKETINRYVHSKYEREIKKLTMCDLAPVIQEVKCINIEDLKDTDL